MKRLFLSLIFALSFFVVQASAQWTRTLWYVNGDTVSVYNPNWYIRASNFIPFNNLNNLFLGADAGKNEKGQYNIFLGYQAGFGATLGDSSNYEVGIGYQALFSDSIGTVNVALGFGSLFNNKTGNGGTAIGYEALYSNNTGYNNTATGLQALYSNSAGKDNTANGVQSLYLSSTGSWNTANGAYAGTFISGGLNPNQAPTMSVYEGYYTMALAANDTNEIVIGSNATGNGSYSVTLGDTTITKTVLRGKVGIGITSPAYNLDVNGTLHTAGQTYLGGGPLHVSTDQTFVTGASYTFRDGVGINNPTGTSFAAGNTVMSIGAMSNGTSLITTSNVGIRTTTPTSTLHDVGSFATNITSPTANYIAAATDQGIFMSAATADTVFLPTSVGIAGRIYTIKKVDATANAVTVRGSGTELIDGSNTYSLTVQYKYVVIQSNGTQWFIIGNN